MWMRRYARFHRTWDFAQLGEAELTSFLSNLVAEREVSASTQNQAVSALLFPLGENCARSAEQRVVRTSTGDSPSGKSPAAQTQGR